MVEGIGGGSSIPPENIVKYKQQFNEAVNLFQQSLDGYEHSTYQNQKAEYKDVMDKAMQIINQTINEVLSKEAQKSQAQLTQDYQTFLSNDNPQTYQQLNNDLDYLKRAK